LSLGSVIGSVVVVGGVGQRRRRALEKTALKNDDMKKKEPQARQLALKRVLEQINFKHGAGAVMRLGQKPLPM